MAEIVLGIGTSHTPMLSLTTGDLWAEYAKGDRNNQELVYPPNGVICGYTSNTFYNGGYFYNGTSPNDPAANGVPENKYFAQSFAPAYGDPNSSNYPLALNLYFSLQVKL